MLLFTYEVGITPYVHGNFHIHTVQEMSLHKCLFVLCTIPLTKGKIVL